MKDAAFAVALCKSGIFLKCGKNPMYCLLLGGAAAVFLNENSIHVATFQTRIAMLPEWPALFHQQHALGNELAVGLQGIDVCARSNFPAQIIHALPDNAVLAGRYFGIQ